MDYGAILLLATLSLSVAALLFVSTRKGPEDTWFVAVARAASFVLLRAIHRVRAWDDRGPSRRDVLPESGPCIVVANHVSGVDPLIVSAVTRRWIRWLMAREYYGTRGMQWLFRRLGCIPVNRDGNDLAATRLALRALKEGRAIGIFPQGGIRGQDDPFAASKSGVALLAARSQAPVVPLYVDGVPQVESVFGALFVPSRSRVFCGRPIVFSQTGGKPARQELESFTASILGEIAALQARAAKVPAKSNGVAQSSDSG